MLLLQGSSRFITSSDRFQSSQTAFDSSKFKHFNLIHWRVNLTNREKANLEKNVFVNLVIETLAVVFIFPFTH